MPVNRQDLSMSNQVLVIGGGIIGTMTAYHLALKGCQVTLLDKNRVGGGASYGNCGLILPHVLPVNMPGVPTLALKWLFKKKAPLRIRPATLLQNLGWFLQFLRNCSESVALHAAEILAPQLLNAAEEWDAIINREQIDCDWHHDGILSLFLSKRHMEMHETDIALERQLGVTAKRLSRSALQEMEPALSTPAAEAWFYPKAGHLRADKLMNGLKSVLLKYGVSIMDQTTFRYFETMNESALSVITDKGKLNADTFILATGAWTPKFQKHLAMPIPIQPGKGYSCLLPVDEQHLQRACILNEARVVLTPFAGAIRLGGTMEFCGYDAQIDETRIQSFVDAAQFCLPNLKSDHISDSWCGWRPMTPDGLPIIGFVPKLRNVILAAGHNMIGLSMANSTAKQIVGLIDKPQSG